MHTLLALGLEDHEQRLHDGVCVEHDHSFGWLAVAQLLDNDLDDAAQEPLHISGSLGVYFIGALITLTGQYLHVQLGSEAI